MNRHLFDSRRISSIQPVSCLPLFHGELQLALLRDDLNHSIVSGNKLRKLKYTLLSALDSGAAGVISFGGGHSNHLHALAYACQQLKLRCRLIVRGEELLLSPSATLQDCIRWGAEVIPVSRQDYRLRYNRKWQEQWLSAGFQLVPEGGTCQLALKGMSEALDERCHDFDFIACAVGSGGTAAGLALALAPHQKLLAFPAVKDKQLPERVQQLIGKKAASERIQWCWGHECGGFGRFPKVLEAFVLQWVKTTRVLPDPVYTAKLFHGIHQLYMQGQLKPHHKVLLYHSGGLQGWRGLHGKLSAEMLAYLGLSQ